MSDRMRTKVLLVEDNPGDVRLIEDMLADVNGNRFEIINASDLAAGLGLLEAETIDVVLLDLGLPDSMGLDTLRRTVARFNEIPVIILTGYEDEAAAIEAAGQQAQDYLVKSHVDGKMLARSIFYAIERKQSEVELERANRSLKVLSECNQAVVRAVDEQAMLDNVCRIIIKHGGYHMVWVGYAEDDETRSVRPVAQCGCDDGYLDAVDIRWSDEKRGHGPTGIAIRTGKASLMRDIAGNPAYEPWRREAKERGYASSLALPLISEGRTLGALNIYSNQSDAFDESEMELLQELANDLAYGVFTLRARAELTRSFELQRASEERYRGLFEGNRDAILVADTQLRIIDLNPAFTSLLGYTLDDLKGKQTLSVYEQEQEFQKLEDSLQERSQADGFLKTVNYRRKDGTVFPGETNVFFARDPGGNTIAFVGLIRDVSERLAAEHALRESEIRYRKLSDATTEAIVIHRDGILLDVNRAFVRMFGYSSEEAIGMSGLDFSAPESREVVSANIDSGYEQPYEAMGLRKDGSTFPGQLQGSNFTFMGQQVRLVTIRDLTEQKRLERQLLQNQKMESIGQLAGGIAHDFNNYLTAIQGYIELAMMETDRHDPVFGDLREAMRSTERAAALTRQLLMFSRSGSVEHKAVDLDKVILELEKMLRRVIGENYKLATRMSHKTWQIFGDEGLLEQVIVNLVVNARDAIPEGGQITILTENVDVDKPTAAKVTEARPGRFVRLTVRDEGAGMNEETLEHIFEPFFSTKREKEGTGLGLSVVYGIVKEHGGWIEVESAPGRGSSFHMYFPEMSSPVVPSSTPEQPVISARHEGVAILLVEDEEPLRAVANKMLSQYGYSVYAAADAEEALRLFNNKGVDFRLAFCDVVLPGENGVELAARLLDMKPGLKIILASGYSEDSVQQTITERGYSFLPKPYRLDTLVQMIEELLGAG